MASSIRVLFKSWSFLFLSVKKEYSGLGENEESHFKIFEKIWKWDEDECLIFFQESRYGFSNTIFKMPILTHNHPTTFFSLQK